MATDEAFGSAETSNGGSGGSTTGNSAAEHADGRDRRRVLVPIDDSAASRPALEYAIAEFPDAELYFLHVIDPIDAGYSTGPAPPGEGPEWYEKRRLAAEALFEEAGELAGDAEVPYETAVELGRPVTCIVGAVADHDVDHVVMGSHGRSGVSRILRGSVAEAVVRRSPVPVTVVR